MDTAAQRRPVRVSAGFVVLITAVHLACMSPPARADAPGDGRRCGEFCLRVALPALDFPAGAAAVAKEHLGVAPAGGHALADLRAAVEAAGGHALAVETAADRLRARRERLGETFACVAHLDGDHWALLSEIRPDGTAKVIDPPGVYELPGPTLAARWDGRALLVSRGPLTPEEDVPGPFPWRAAALGAAALLGVAGLLLWRRRDGDAAGTSRVRPAGVASGVAGCLAVAAAGCGGAGDRAGGSGDDGPPPAGPPRAAFEVVRRDAGTIAIRPEGHELVFPVTNRGGGPLRFTQITTSCQCTGAEVDDDVLPPGGATVVRLRISPKSPQRKEAVAVVRTNDPEPPRRKVDRRVAVGRAVDAGTGGIEVRGPRPRRGPRPGHSGWSGTGAPGRTPAGPPPFPSPPGRPPGRTWRRRGRTGRTGSRTAPRRFESPRGGNATTGRHRSRWNWRAGGPGASSFP